MQTEELSGQAQNSTPSVASEEEKLTPSSDEALKEIKEATGAKNKEVGQGQMLLQLPQQLRDLPPYV